MEMIYNRDCILGARKYFEDESVDLICTDPPFGINESTFDKHYKRSEDKVIKGYVEAPKDYHQFTYNWVSEAKRILKKNGSMYIVSGWTNSHIIANVLDELGLKVINKIIWHFNFGVATKKKFVTSHYDIFYVSKPGADVTFNSGCRYGSQEKTESGGSLQYKDMQSVWCINKEYQPGKEKNKNKLPEALVKKMILYSSNEGDVVFDFFLGNFTTAVCAKKLSRVPSGFELNQTGFHKFASELDKVEAGSDLLIVRDERPENQGQKITKEIADNICSRYKELYNKHLNRKEVIYMLSNEFGRGRFSIDNILKEHGVSTISREEEDLFDI